MKGSVMFVALIFIVVGLSVVALAQPNLPYGEMSVFIEEGWNLVYGVIEPDQIQGLDVGNVLAIYAFIPNTQEYASIYPELGNNVNDIDDDILINTAFWVYTDKSSHSDEITLLTDVMPFDERPLYAGWNFVGITPDMEGLISQGSCNIEKAAIWENQNWDLISEGDLADATNGAWSWDKFGLIDHEQDIGRGIVFKVSHDCKLSKFGESSGGPPSLPGDMDNAGLRRDIEDYYYEEFAYEACDLNGAQEFNSKADCEAGHRCLAEEYASLIPSADLQDLADYMAEHGGESGSIYYDGRNPSVNEQLRDKFDDCLSGRHEDY